ncbi:Germin protein [Dioscorea alata]|uniref:Germin protein n=1 Tax=Dioscorea alata TaxID=55571 RepID=A0ACB7U4N6_DIOAL|nr:Germin protein [Dioscorea alata]
MKDASFIQSLFSIFLLFSDTASVVADPDLLQDLCVADLNSSLRVNGFACKPAATVSEADFSYAGLAKAGDTNSTVVGSKASAATKIPGLHTLGISMARVDYAPGGVNPPHTHPRATEIAFVLEGTLEVGFITTANKLISKTISTGEVFIFPRGLIHFQRNTGTTPAAALAAFNSQLPGTQSLALTLFTASPAVPEDVLEKAFQIGSNEVDKIKDRLHPK